MAGSINRVTLVGNLGGDPEVRYTTSKKAVASMNVATTEKWTDGNGIKQERTEWHKVIFWERQAEICGEYLRKGSKVYVEGSLQTRKWTDKEGIERYTTEIRGRELVMLGDPPGGRQQRGEGGGRRSESADRQSAPAAADEAFFDDDIPF